MLQPHWDFEKNSEVYLTSSPAKSNTLVMVTLAGPDAFGSALKRKSFNVEESVCK